MSEVNERSRLDEAVSVGLAVRPFDNEKMTVSEYLPEFDQEDREQLIRAALLSALPVLLGEALVWQYRGAPNEQWVLCPKQSAETFASLGYETRALYASSLGEGHE